MMDYNRELLEFLRKSPTAYQLAANQAEILEGAGYLRLSENEDWQLQRGGCYYVTRNGSALIAFRLPGQDDAPFMIMASHGDCPALKLKEAPEMEAAGGYTRLNVENYGGGILSSWLDRPLSVAGRITVRTEKGFRTIPVNVDRDLLLIPSLAIHMNREANKGWEINVQRDMLPLLGGPGASLMEIVAEAAGVDAGQILSAELFLYNRTAPSIWGAAGEYMSAPHFDDGACAFASLKGLLESGTGEAIPIHAVFDNEEVGSSTKQGAASTFLRDTLLRVNRALGGDEVTFIRRISESFMLSADNGHAIHPNYPEKCDPVTRPVLGGGVVLKYSANQRYTTDGESAAICISLAEKAGIRLQRFFNRSDMPGGSTLGNISGNQLAIRTADVGLAQLAMHSCYETCSTKDLPDLIGLARSLYESRLSLKAGETLLR